jgi:CheY-like chemotaxis protein
MAVLPKNPETTECGSPRKRGAVAEPCAPVAPPPGETGAERAATAQRAADRGYGLRTPLGAIIDMTRLLLDKAADGEMREGLATILQSAAVLQERIDMLLDLSGCPVARPAAAPRPGGEPAQSRAAPPPASGTPSCAGARAGLRILLAEDEPVNRIFTVRALQKLGHSVQTAADGREALAMLGRERFDLVLMDIQMPRLNGLDATRMIRAGQVPDLDAAIPVVALTAYAMDADRELGFEAGMDEYVTKPFEPQELAAALERALVK